MSPPPGGVHGRFERRVARPLEDFVQLHRLGEVFTESGFALSRDPDTVLGPDVSFVEASRIPESGPPVGYFEGAPNLAVEIVSRGNRARQLLRKVGEYLDAGAQRVWLVYPEQQMVTVYRPGGDVRALRIGDTLTSDDAGFDAEGFELPLADLFA
jgi:Uma2 family endonuclease